MEELVEGVGVLLLFLLLSLATLGAGTWVDLVAPCNNSVVAAMPEPFDLLTDEMLLLLMLLPPPPLFFIFDMRKLRFEDFGSRLRLFALDVSAPDR